MGVALPDDSVSVVVVSLDGMRFLPDLLSRLEAQRHRPLEILLVDNGSTDGTADWVRRRHPSVRVVTAPGNVGFARGANLGLEASKGKWIALLDNDCLPEGDWLYHLVRAARESRGVAAVCSKVVFWKPYVPLGISVDATRAAPSDSRALGLAWDLENGFEDCDYPRRIFVDGFYGAEAIGGRTFRWSGPEATVLLPIPTIERPATLRLRALEGEVSPPRAALLWIGSCLLGEVSLPMAIDVRLPVPVDVLRREAVDVFNSAGVSMSPSGRLTQRGRDEPDRGQFETPEDVDAVTSTSVLLDREALEAVGPFDERFFVHYEDADLSWRLRAHGLRLRYEPRSVVRHYLGATVREGSPGSEFYQLRNRLLMLAKNGSARSFLRAYRAELRSTLESAGSRIRDREAASPTERSRLATRLHVQKSLVRHLPGSWLRRSGRSTALV